MIMATINSQRDIVNNIKKETFSNLSILSKIYPMNQDLARLIFLEGALQKPTQHIFIHLSYYLICIVDAQKAAKITWPVYDTKSERTYRTEFSCIITGYFKQGAISPVMSSYFVNPGCYKVTKLMFQLSQLAVQQALICKTEKDNSNTLYNDFIEKYQSGSKDSLEVMYQQTADHTINKIKRFLQKRNASIQVAEKMKQKIIEYEEKLLSIKNMGLPCEFVDDFIRRSNYDDNLKSELNKLKNIHEPVPILDVWLEHLDEEITKMESEWDNNVSPFIKLCKSSQESAEALILRHSGEMDKKSYMVEYDPKTDQIDTKDLETQVNSQQKYILKNIIKEERLNFPNLIRGFVIAMCYILKNAEMGDIHFVNQCLEVSERNFAELVSAFKAVIERVDTVDTQLQKSPPIMFNQSIPLKELSKIPAMPDLSDLKSNWDTYRGTSDAFTPLHSSDYHFNFRQKSIIPTFNNNELKTLVTPFKRPQSNGFLSGLKSCGIKFNTQTKLNMSQNISMISDNRANETIAECSTGFTKQQIQRLLSTKKSSSSKKNKFQSEYPNVNIKKGGLFNESIDTGLFRSYSSPNLFEEKEKRSRCRRLSTMREALSPELSGITALDTSSPGTPKRFPILENSLWHLDTTSVPNIMVTSAEDLQMKFNHILKETEDLNVEINPENIKEMEVLQEESIHKSTESLTGKTQSIETPKNNSQPILRKTSSIEKIINRYKKVRASCVYSGDNKEESKSDFRTIHEEKDNNLNPVVNVVTANRVLLPDLLSPMSAISKDSTIDFVELEEKEFIKPRQSLGTVLGVDETFLDQFDLID